jgi:exonuclease III
VERRFTRRFEGRGELIDHLLVSQALVQHVDSVDTTSDVPTITADPAARKDAPGSDHAMVFAHLSIG